MIYQQTLNNSALSASLLKSLDQRNGQPDRDRLCVSSSHATAFFGFCSHIVILKVKLSPARVDGDRGGVLVA